MPIVRAPAPPAVRKPVPIVDQTGGIDYSTDAFQINSKYWLEALNVDPAPGGGASMRGVVTPMHTDTLPAKPSTLGYYERVGGDPQLLIGLADGTIRYITAPSGVVGASTQILASVGPYVWRGAQSRGVFYLHDGHHAARRWDGATMTPLSTTYNGTTWSPLSTYNNGGMPIGRLIAVMHNRVWLVIGNDKLAWSYPLTLDGGPEDWGTDDFVLCDPGTGGTEITAILAASDRLFIFKEHATYMVLGWSPETFRLFPVSTMHGAAGPEAVCTDGNRIYAYDTHDGLHVVSPADSGGMASDEGKVFRPMSRLIRDERIAEAGSKDIVIGHVNDRVYVSLVLDGERQTLALDLRTTSWTRYDLQLGDMGYFHPGGRSVPVACSWYADRPYRVLQLDRLGDTDDDGTTEHSVDSFFQTAWVYDDAPTVSKNWPYIDFIMDADDDQALTVSLSYDWDSDTSLSLGTVESTSTHRTTRVRKRVPPLETTAISVKVTGPTPSKRWSVRGIVPTYSLSRRPL